MRPIKKILVPTDFSPQAELAARYAVELADKVGASVTLLNVYFMPVAVPFPDGSAYIPSASVMAELATNAERDLAKLRDTVAKPGVEVKIASSEGPPKELIAPYAKQHDYDLIVMGTHGRTGLKHFVLGSVAEAVVRTATCPVVTVPSKHSAHSAPNAPVL